MGQRLVLRIAKRELECTLCGHRVGYTIEESNMLILCTSCEGIPNTYFTRFGGFMDNPLAAMLLGDNIYLWIDKLGFRPFSLDSTSKQYIHIHDPELSDVMNRSWTDSKAGTLAWVKTFDSGTKYEIRA